MWSCYATVSILSHQIVVVVTTPAGQDLRTSILIYISSLRTQTLLHEVVAGSLCLTKGATTPDNIV